jgi:NAD(P)-dependent dehydrogenase (short-subunit alcohol dehydrogenase family)
VNVPVNVIVGAASGMGTAVARALVGRGGLLLADRDGPAVDSLARELGDAEAMTCDITDEADVATLATRIGRLGALVVTAGLSPTAAAPRQVWEVNLLGMARLLDGLDDAAGEGTAAVCFASVAGHIAQPTPAVTAVLDDPLAPALLDRLAAAGVDLDDPASAYCLSKLGVIRLAKRLATTWGPRGARIVSISPGIVDTPMTQQMLALPGAREATEERVAHTPFGRAGRPEELAAVAAFLCSPDASFLTGTDVVVDGGGLAADEFPTTRG